jgi:hypothetical protein
MCCSPDVGIQISLFNVEVDIKSVQNIERNIAKHLIDHLDIATATLNILGSFLADLNPRRVERRVLVLIGAHEDHMFEPVETFAL